MVPYEIYKNKETYELIWIAGHLLHVEQILNASAIVEYLISVLIYV
jgi:hypothetical protein